MILSNTETVPGKTIVEFYGVVSGKTVRARCSSATANSW